jgi:hypothetical protein
MTPDHAPQASPRRYAHPVKRAKKILLGIAATLVVLAVGYATYLHYALRHMGDGIHEFGDFLANRIQDVARPVAEADAVLHYDPTGSRFSFRPTANPQQTATVPEAELTNYIQRTMTPKPKLVVFYRQADFATPADRVAFESRIRTSLEAGGAASVTFVFVEQPTTEKSLFE